MTPGHDGVPTEVFQNLEGPALDTLLEAINQVWETGGIPCLLRSRYLHGNLPSLPPTNRPSYDDAIRGAHPPNVPAPKPNMTTTVKFTRMQRSSQTVAVSFLSSTHTCIQGHQRYTSQEADPLVMELQAIHDAIQAVTTKLPTNRHLHIFTDSLAAIRELKKVYWIQGHATNQYNLAADQQAHFPSDPDLPSLPLPSEPLSLLHARKHPLRQDTRALIPPCECSLPRHLTRVAEVVLRRLRAGEHIELPTRRTTGDIPQVSPRRDGSGCAAEEGAGAAIVKRTCRLTSAGSSYREGAVMLQRVFQRGTQHHQPPGIYDDAQKCRANRQSSSRAEVHHDHRSAWIDFHFRGYASCETPTKGAATACHLQWARSLSSEHVA
ncbi:hypothetical protein HPB47_025579 [Ixodes persulcatus]|uniref:Uncharacterized protein n=1 Tax=Ixodes persulcatus TaxID=34615 RepID=A0AC60Q2C1_IXOPE|nr:hypothetical protein HPB47_025579 [Ixodes persulcatus]